jgi:glycosyltransferase involved in cell wall biosynthesis
VTRGVETKSVSTLSYGVTASFHAAREQPDVALVMNVANGYFLPLLRARGIPTLVNVDGIEWDREKWGALAKLVFKGGAWTTARWASELVVDAEEIDRRWREKFARGGTFIPYGGDELPDELPIEPGLRHREYALVVARFVPENTVPEFFEAVERIAAQRQVVIVGSSGYGGELDEKAQALANRFDNVRAYGHVRDDNVLLSLWQHAGAYFHGHSVGGTNPALVQAMAAGTPIVARDTVYTREVLRDNAVFVGPDPAQIAAAIEQVLTDAEQQERLSAGVIARAREYYSWSGVCSAYERALRGLIRPAPASARAEASSR